MTRKEPTPPPAGGVKPPPPPAPPSAQAGVAVTKMEPEENSKLLDMAKTPQERAFAFEQLTRRRQEQMVRRAAQEIALMSWGKDLSQAARAAVAFFAYECGTNPVTHWIVLGGNLYDTSLLWFDLATSQPDYEGYESRHINDDDRLDDASRAERRSLRAQYNIPEDVKGACIVTIWKRLANGQLRAFSGVNHAGNRQGFNARKGAAGLIKDPIGEQDPGKTAETRAFRRAAKRCWPIWRFKRDIPENEGLNVEELARGEINELLTAEGAEASKAQPGKLDNVAHYIPVPGADGLQIRTTEGDRLPVESLKAIEHGYPGGGKIETVEGLGSAGGAFELINEVLLICDGCGNHDSIADPTDLHPTPECSGGCGERMRPMTTEEIHEREIRQEDAELAKE
ncbi:hypothetical protein LCGC14_1148740 [marine sediment metagenome]|uniref:Uncharacterized protein n=1 Tax=marine sediment metagenome TaxID=412755 RepID=A0A0F9M141_9ZZZZ